MRVVRANSKYYQYDGLYNDNTPVSLFSRRIPPNHAFNYFHIENQLIGI